MRLARQILIGLVLAAIAAGVYVLLKDWIVERFA